MRWKPARMANRQQRHELRRRAARSAAALSVQAALLITGCVASTSLHTKPDGQLDGRPVAEHERIVELGRSVNGRPLRMHVFGDAPNPVLIFAGIHGSEPASTALARRLVQHLRSNGRLPHEHGVAVLPAANPDGLAARTRTNTRGVDLNRNFPAQNWKLTRPSDTHGGPRPQSEPETDALVHAVRSMAPSCIVSIHSISGRRQCNNYDGPGSTQAALLAASNGYPVKATIGYPTPGSFGSWAGIDLQIPTITLELPRGIDPDQAWAENRDGLLSLISARPGRLAK